MTQGTVIFGQQLQIGAAGQHAEQQRRQTAQRDCRVFTRADLAQQTRHQLIQRLTATRANGAPADVLTKRFQRLMQRKPLIVTELRHQRCQLVILQLVLPQHLKLCQLTLIANLRRIFPNQFVKDGTYRCHLSIKLGHQRRPVSTIHRPRQTGAMQLIFWQRLGLLVAQALQQILQPPQEQIGVTQRIHLLSWQQGQRFYCFQRRQQGT